MIKRMLLSATVLLALAGGSVPAAENLGVPICPGAKYDEQLSKLQAQVTQAMGGGKSACYRTKDTVANVVRFYQKDGFRLGTSAATEDEALLQKGDSLNIRIKNLHSLDNSNDTSICILKK